MNKFEQMGAEAFAKGDMRFAPLTVLTGENGEKDTKQGIDDTTAWFKGWDRANLAAPVPGWTEAENAAMLAAVW